MLYSNFNDTAPVQRLFDPKKALQQDQVTIALILLFVFNFKTKPS